MKFLYPQFLYAFAFLAIPVIIHLFQFRRFKTIYFSNVRFLSSIQEEKQTKSRLKHLIVLLFRLLIIASLVMAFSQPYFPGERTARAAGKNAVSIYIDNSFSMMGISQEGSLLELAKKKAEELVNVYREADVFQLLTNDFETKHQRFYNKNDFFDHLARTKQSPSTRSLSEVFERQKAAFARQTNSQKTAFIISDFQKSTSRLFNLENIDTSINYYFVPLTFQQKGNVFIDTAWLEAPILQLNQTNRLKVKVINNSSKKLENQTVSLDINGKQEGIASFNLKPGNSKVVKIVFTISETGWNKGAITISDYPITFDDKYYITFPVKRKARILLINGGKPNPYLSAVYETDPYFSVKEVSSGKVDHSTFPDYEFIVLNELSNISTGLISELKDFLDHGGNVLLIPPPDPLANFDSYDQFLTSLRSNRYKKPQKTDVKVNRLTTRHPFFQDVFEEVPENVNLPQVSRYYPQTSLPATRERTLLKMENDQSFLSFYPYEKGLLFTSAVPFRTGWTNFPRHAIFVPMIYRMTLFKNVQYQLAYFIAAENVLELNLRKKDKDQVFKLVRDGFESIPPQKYRGGVLRMYLSTQLKKAGIYQLTSNRVNDQYNQSISYPLYGFNYNRNESQLETYGSKTLESFAGENNIHVIEDQYQNAGKTVRAMEKGNSFWKTFIWLALAFLLVETLLLKFWVK